MSCLVAGWLPFSIRFSSIIHPSRWLVRQQRQEISRRFVAGVGVGTGAGVESTQVIDSTLRYLRPIRLFRGYSVQKHVHSTSKSKLVADLLDDPGKEDERCAYFDGVELDAVENTVRIEAATIRHNTPFDSFNVGIVSSFRRNGIGDSLGIAARLHTNLLPGLKEDLSWRPFGPVILTLMPQPVGLPAIPCVSCLRMKLLAKVYHRKSNGAQARDFLKMHLPLSFTRDANRGS